MHNPYRGGTWDVWYSGIRGDLWVEYKWLSKWQAQRIITPDLSALQLDWGRSRIVEGRNLAVIIGCPDGGVIYDMIYQWEHGMCGVPQKRAAVAAWIFEQTGAAHDPSKSGTGRENSRVVL